MSVRPKLSPEVRKALDSVRLAMDKGKLPEGTVSRELGLSGTTIWAGDVQSEQNPALIHQLAFGRAGSRAWGEWDKLMRGDEAVAKAIDFSAARVRGCRLEVTEPSEDAGIAPAVATAMTDFVRFNLTQALEPTWEEVLMQMARGPLMFGFAVHEVVMDGPNYEHPLLPGGKGWRVQKLAQRLPGSIHPNGWVEKGGELQAIRQWGPLDGRWLDVTLPADRVLLTNWGREGNNYLGFSAFRAVWRICKVREQLLNVLAIGAMREAAGVPVAEMARDVKLSVKARKKLQNFLGNMVLHENASAVLPSGVTLKWLFSPGANKGHVLDTWKELGVHVLGQVQAQQMALGLSGTGSRSVGTIHDQVADAFSRGLLANITSVVNGVGSRAYTGLVKKIVDPNWGPQKAYPVVSLVPTGAALPADQYAVAMAALKSNGIIKVWRREDENAAREKVGHTPVTEDEWDEQQQKADELQKQMQQQPQFPPKPGGPPQPPKPGQSPVPPKPGKLRASATWQPRRPLRASEQHLALSEMVDFLDGGKERFERLAKPVVVEMLTKALPEVRDAMKDGRIDNDELAHLKLDTKRLEAVIGDFLDTCRREGYRQVANEYNKAARPLRAAAEEDEKFEPAEPDTQTEQLLTAQRKQLARKMASRLRDNLESTAIDVLRTGGEPEEVVSDVVADQVESKSLQADAGGVMTRAFNMGREEFADENADKIDSCELSAILDDNTCDYCDSMDGTELEFGSDNEEALTPPLRQCEGRGKCRCLKVFNFKEPGFAPVDDE